MARDERSEEALLTSPNIQAKAPKNQLGQPALAADEGIEEPLFNQPKSPGKSTWLLARELQLGFFIDLNLLFTSLYPCLLL